MSPTIRARTATSRPSASAPTVVVHRQGVALRVQPEALRPRQREQDGPPGDVGQQRRLALHGQVLLAAEGPAGRDLADADVGLGPPEERRDLAAVVPGALALGEEVEARLAGRGRSRPLGNGEACLGLEEGVLHGARREPLADDVGGRGKRRGGVAPPHDRGREQVAALVDGRGPGVEGGERVDDGLEDLVLDLHEGGRRPGMGAGRRRRPRPARRRRNGSSRPRRRTPASRR